MDNPAAKLFGVGKRKIKRIVDEVDIVEPGRDELFQPIGDRIWGACSCRPSLGGASRTEACKPWGNRGGFGVEPRNRHGRGHRVSTTLVLVSGRSSDEFWLHSNRVLSLDYVSFARYIRLGNPSLQWVPWPPLAGALRFSTFLGTIGFYDCAIPNGRCLPSLFGIQALRDGFAR